MWRKNIDSIIETALREDMPQGDITSESIIPLNSISRAIILAKEEGILAGIYVVERVYKIIEASVLFERYFKDGQRIKKGDKIAALKGPSISILKGERTALNFIQRLSGIATATQKYVKAVQGTRTKVLDTRKTTPGLRILEKYAVKMGGGTNHRLNLSEMVLIKDNHLKIVGSISEAVKSARRRIKPGIKIEVETSNLDEVKEAFQGGADMIMLDNMSLRKMKEVVQWVKGRVILEVSGNINLRRAKQIAALGVDFISVGSLTHSNKSLDISMEFLD